LYPIAVFISAHAKFQNRSPFADSVMWFIFNL
jgi:hypothetical protein